MSNAVYAVFLRQEDTQHEIFVEYHESPLEAIEACKRVAREDNEKLFGVPRGGIGPVYKTFVRGMPRKKALLLAGEN